MIKHRRRSVLSVFMLAQLGLAAAACGPADAARDETLAISRAELTTWESAKEGWKQLSGLGKKLGGWYSDAKSAVDVALFLGEILGIVQSQPSVEEQLAALRAQLESEAQDLDYRFLEFERNMYFGGVHSAFVEALQTDVANGARIPRHGGFNPQSASALDSAGGLPMFRRRFSEQATAGPWKDILFNMNQPEKYPGNVVFDWRLSVPWYLNMVSMRLAVMAAVDPLFMTNHSFDVELLDIRSRLQEVRRLMVRDVRCQALNRIFFNWDTSQNEYSHTDLACADVNTGVSAVSQYFASGEPTDADLAWRLDDLKRQVLNSMPLFEVDAMIDTLFHYAHPETLDLTKHWAEEITLEASPALCLDVTGNNPAAGTPVQVWPCLFANSQWWQYNRKTGRIINPAFGRCLEVRPGTPAFMARAGAPAQIGDCSDPLPPHQQWSYDRENKVLRNGLNTVLDVQGANLAQGTPVWLWDNYGGVAQQWHAEQPHGLSAGPATQCGMLKPGEGLFPGQEATSCDGAHKLRFETNGNLVLYKRVVTILVRPPTPPGGFPTFPPVPPTTSFRFDPVWSTGTADLPGAMLIMRSDGNLVLYNFMEAVLWSTNTSGRPGAIAEIRNDIGLIVTQGGQTVWAR